MDNKLTLTMMMRQVSKTFEQALQLAGNQALNKMYENMQLMNEQQAIDYLSDMMSNPYSTLVPYLKQLETDYEAHKKDPEAMGRVIKEIANQLDMEESEVLEVINEGKPNDDDSTKH